ncbi:serine hydrolase [Pedobacter sp. JY14-1]|uniref:serine hydrolase n=1 Tax=Pedobacter sp. JY14-1 TaxID=3034151 RepID=UPI0023E0C2C4|nr:serine hydrolase [Pedobacter sp. JY14-1]
MKYYARLSVLLLLMCPVVILTPASGQPTVARIDTFLNNLNADHNINGNVLVAQEGRILYEKAFGFADAASGKTNNPDTRFVMASVSKPVTAVAVFQLIERGKLSLDARVARYLSDFPYPDITVRHLLAHTSGLPNTEELFSILLAAHPERLFVNKDIIPALRAYGKPAHFKAGDQFEYSNTNYSLLALLIEKQSGRTFRDYMSRFVFKPAGMNSTEILEPDFKYRPGFAHKYDRPVHYLDTLRPIESVKELHKFTYNWVGFQGPGNMASTIHDMLAFDQGLYAGKLVSGQSMKQMFTPNRLNDGSIPYRRSGIDEAAYGLGWYIFKDTAGGKVVWHSGGIPGMNTFILRNLDKKQFITVTDNAQNGPVAPELYILLSSKPFGRPRSLAKLYVNALVYQGANYAAAVLGEHRLDPGFGLSEGELNFFGLELMENGKLPLALEVFKTSTMLFPKSFNVFDSYGEALMKAGKKAEAILMYRRSLELNPANEGGKKALRQLVSE